MNNTQPLLIPLDITLIRARQPASKSIAYFAERRMYTFTEHPSGDFLVTRLAKTRSAIDSSV